MYLYLYRYPLGWHTLPSHASAEGCLTGWPNAQPQEGTTVVLRDIIRLTRQNIVLSIRQLIVIAVALA